MEIELANVLDRYLAAHSVIGEAVYAEPTWWVGRNRYQFEVILRTEPEGGFSVQAAALPGAISEGDTVDEALDNICDALQGLLEHYREEGKDLERVGVPLEPEKGDLVRWVIVDLNADGEAT